LAVEIATKLAKCVDGEGDQAAGRPSDQAGKGALYAVQCARLIRKTLTAPPQGPRIPLFCKFNLKPQALPIENETTRPIIQRSAKQKFLGGFVSIPGKFGLGEVACFCSKA
jgi:hypothetical protein